jgi:hypothetical protein
MDFWHTDRAVRVFSRALGWSLCKGIPKVVLAQQFEIVCGLDRKQTISTCFSEAKNQKSRPIFSTCPGLCCAAFKDLRRIKPLLNKHNVPYPYRTYQKMHFKKLPFEVTMVTI